LRLGRFFNRYEKQWSQNRLQLWGHLMQNIQLHCEGRVALSLIDTDVLAAYGAGRNDLENFVSFLQCLHGVDVTLLLRENGPGRSKASFRSVDVVNVQAMAAEFGGGGHRNAAGAEFNLVPGAAAPLLLEAVSRHLALAAEKG
jgi:phosphoesterase RecJ-like protein